MWGTVDAEDGIAKPHVVCCFTENFVSYISSGSYEALAHAAES